MIEHSFCHLKGITPDREKEIWEAGIRHWDEIHQPNTLPPAILKKLHQQIPICREKLEIGDLRFFADGFPNNRLWRIFSQARHSIAYLDIETTGMSRAETEITTIAVFDGHNIHTFVQGQNLDQFPKIITQYDVIVTFNGKTFDLPILRDHFDLPLDQPHLDLRYILKPLNLTGGLKAIEKKLGISRGDADGLDGEFAIHLWKDYKYFQNDKALETLLAYNVEDVINLEKLMVIAWNLMLRARPEFKENMLSMPDTPANPFKVDRATVEKLIKRYPPRW